MVEANRHHFASPALRTGAEIFPVLSPGIAISKTSRTRGVPERGGSRRTYTARPNSAAPPLTSNSKCFLGEAGGEVIFLWPLCLPEVLLPRQRGRAFPRPWAGSARTAVGSAGAARCGRRRGGHREGRTDFSSHRSAVVSVTADFIV